MWWGIPVSLAGLAISFFIPILIMHNRNCKYPFNADEMYGYAKEKIFAMQRGEVEAPKPLFR